jgi:para-nitrobenzyl esterase
MGRAWERPVFGALGRLAICMLIAYAAVACALTAAASAQGVIPTSNGPVRGTETAAMKEYLGIPYAAAPVGDLRWRPPQPHARWGSPLDAAAFGNHCPQPASPFGRASTSEDCLFLNVFTPNRRPGNGHAKHLPVMFWIHGGGLVVGESDDYDPTRLVQQGVVVVTFNYRLGYLGFLAHPSLTAEGGGSSGNYGLMDQQAALRWVQRNIAKFGGDPDNVTIFGQSAGGLSVHSQLASPPAAGLFDRAIVQSGAYVLSLPSLARAETQGAGVAHDLACDDGSLACLRAVPPSSILAIQPETAGAINPNVDGNVLPLSIGDAFASGQFNRVPVIEGSTHDEFSIFAAIYIEFEFGQIPTSFYPIVLSIFLPMVGLPASAAPAVQAEYPISTYNNVLLAVTALATDAVFACPGRTAAQSLSQYVPTYAYEFNDPNAPQPFLDRQPSFPLRAFHASELRYLYDPPPGLDVPLNGDQQKLADAMVSYWTRFAGTGDPNSPSTPAWPGYTTATDRYMSLEPPTPQVITDFAADHHCAFWASL